MAKKKNKKYGLERKKIKNKKVNLEKGKKEKQWNKWMKVRIKLNPWMNN